MFDFFNDFEWFVFYFIFDSECDEWIKFFIWSSIREDCFGRGVIMICFVLELVIKWRKELKNVYFFWNVWL